MNFILKPIALAMLVATAQLAGVAHAQAVSVPYAAVVDGKLTLFGVAPAPVLAG